MSRNQPGEEGGKRECWKLKEQHVRKLESERGHDLFKDSELAHWVGGRQEGPERSAHFKPRGGVRLYL